MFEKTKEKSDDSRGWFTLEEMAEAFGITPQGFAKTVRPLLADADVRGAGGKGTKVRCRGAIDAWAAHQAEKAAAEAAKKSDPLLVGQDSPALEEYRRHRAGLAKIELEQKQRTHVALAELNQTLNRFAGHVRRGGEILQRRFGNEAAEIFNSAIADAEAVTRQEIGGSSAK